MGLGRKGKWEREGKHYWLKSLYALAQGRSRDLSRGRTFAEQPCLRHTSQPSTASKRCVSITAFTSAADRLLAAGGPPPSAGALAPPGAPGGAAGRAGATPPAGDGQNNPSLERHLCGEWRPHKMHLVWPSTVSRTWATWPAGTPLAGTAGPWSGKVRRCREQGTRRHALQPRRNATTRLHVPHCHPCGVAVTGP